MADNTEDVRTKISPADHRLLTALALGAGGEISEYVRGIILDHLTTERRKHRLVADALQGEGAVGNGRASP